MGMWREHVSKVSGATSVTVYSEPVPPGERWFLQRVVLVDETTDAANCLVGIDARTHSHPLYYFKDLVKAEYGSQELKAWLFEGERLRFDWTDVGAADQLRIFITGHKQGE